jgi:hypothetical protein
VGKGFRAISNRNAALEGMLSVLKDPCDIPAFLLRGKYPTLMDNCPKFRDSVTPVIFHLPKRTALRVIENLRPVQIGNVFLENGRSKFGLDSAVVVHQLPRWRGHNDVEKASNLASYLTLRLLSNPAWLPVPLLPQILHTTGNLHEAGLITAGICNEVFKCILPACLEKCNLRRVDILDLIKGVSKLKIEKGNSILFPMMANFAGWFLERQKINASRRHRKRELETRAERLLASNPGASRKLIMS